MRIRRVLITVVAALMSTLVVGASAEAAAGPIAIEGWNSNPQNIINYNSNKCLQPQSLDPNALVVQRTCDGSSIQKWTAIDRGTGYSALVNSASGLCMDLQVNSEAEVGNGVLVQQFWCSTVYTSEEWNKVNGSRTNHFQVFTRIRPTICLDVRDRSSANNAVLQIWSCKFPETAQEFRFLDA